MAEEKKYYWIKLKTNFFNSEQIDFLMSQNEGSKYVVLYQMLCLNTANTDGKLESRIGEMIVPYDIGKIVRDTKYFNENDVIVSLELFKKLGLIYEEDNQILKISNFDEMVGGESKWAEKKRLYREKQKQLQLGQGEDNVRQEYRDKSLENRVKDIKDIDIELEEKKEELKNSPKTTTKKFIKPSLEEVKTYCKERNNKIDAEQFIDYYEANGWKVGKNSMKDWKAAVRTWERRNTTTKNTKPVREEIVPHWLNQKTEKEPMSQEELEELEEFLGKEKTSKKVEYQPNPEFQKRLKEKYRKKNSL